MDISRRLCARNDEIIRAVGQLKQIMSFIPTLASILFVFIFAVAVAFMSNTVYNYTFNSTLLPVTNLVFGVLLIILLPIHLVRATLYLWSLVSTKYIAYEIMREMAWRSVENIERRYPIDYEGPMKRMVETMLEVYKETSDEEDETATSSET